jgi:hypothetical protein
LCFRFPHLRHKKQRYEGWVHENKVVSEFFYPLFRFTGKRWIVTSKALATL